MNRITQRGAGRLSRAVFVPVALPLVLLAFGCSSPAPDPAWVQAFGYTSENVHAIEVGQFGYPYVPVDIRGTRIMLPFDTGNMVGVMVSSDLFDRLKLTSTGSWDRMNSAGQRVASLRVSPRVNVSMLGRDRDSTLLYELNHPDLDGLVGPTVLDGNHFTLDYASRRMALGGTPLPDSVPGFRTVPLVRSSQHPLLVLVKGTIEGWPVLIELDTGKSRTVVNPALASKLNLERAPRGVAIKNLQIGNLSFSVPSAKEVDQTGIDPNLPEPIRVGVGSDILSRFVWTVDYETGVLWIPNS